MSRLLEIAGWGAVSPAGWSTADLAAAVTTATHLPPHTRQRSPDAPAYLCRPVPTPETPHPWLRLPRLRRTSPISRFALAAALEAMHGYAPPTPAPSPHRSLGVLFAVQNGSVNFSQRFFSEVITNPALASPILFPETVFNAPSSHLSSVLQTPAENYTLVSDAGAFLTALDVAAQWLDEARVTDCLIVAAEELDWLSAEALALYPGQKVATEGSAALWIRSIHDPTPGTLLLDQITDAHPINTTHPRTTATAAVRQQLTVHPGDLLLSAISGSPTWDAPHHRAWQSAPVTRIPLQPQLGHPFSVLGGWQTVLACHLLSQPLRSNNGPNAALAVADTGATQAIAARFVRS